VTSTITVMEMLCSESPAHPDSGKEHIFARLPGEARTLPGASKGPPMLCLWTLTSKRTNACSFKTPSCRHFQQPWPVSKATKQTVR
jgi:hypothetical protein